MTEIDVEMRQNSTSERRIQNAISREERKKDESIRTVRLHGAYKHCYYLHCYSSNAIGFLAISTQGWVLRKRSSSRSWVFVKLSRNQWIFRNLLPITPEGNRPIVQAEISLSRILFLFDRNNDCEISRVGGLYDASHFTWFWCLVTDN